MSAIQEQRIPFFHHADHAVSTDLCLKSLLGLIVVAGVFLQFGQHKLICLLLFVSLRLSSRRPHCDEQLDSHYPRKEVNKIRSAHEQKLEMLEHDMFRLISGFGEEEDVEKF